MDDNITAISSSTVEYVGDGDSDIPVSDSCRELFDTVFPYYLAIGMTYDEFYKKDHTLARAYRKAYKKRREKENENMWLLGAYFYHAMVRSAPMLAPFSKNPSPQPYLDKPFELFAEEKSEGAGNEAVADKGFAYMQAQMMKFNKKFGKE